MQLTSQDLVADQPISGDFAFAIPHAENHVELSANRNPQLAWSDVPAGTQSLVLICVDTDVPTKPDDVNQEGREVPADLPRADFYHWVMVDIPPSVKEIAAGSCSDGITAGGKSDPAGPSGSRQGLNDYTGWFAGDADMGGDYFGYDGPCPPWNDSLIHHYHFKLLATDLAQCPVNGAFTGPEVMAALSGHVLAEAEIVGTYSLNPRLL